MSPGILALLGTLGLIFAVLNAVIYWKHGDMTNLFGFFGGMVAFLLNISEILSLFS